jgi:hypothetical protein
MATGNYGTIRLADVSPDDVEIIYNYTPSRDATENFVLGTIDTANLKPYYNNTQTGGNDNELLGGLYNLTLPTDTFNQLGIYTIMIRPAQIRTKITDCGVLSSLPNVKGIILDINNFPTEFQNKFINQGLVGFRVEYLDSNGAKVANLFRVITSNFYCEPVTQNLTNTIQKSVRYRYSEVVTNLMFCTLSPSASPTNKPTATPNIGVPDQDIIITNTFFNPTMLEVEIVEHDISTLAIALYGNQTKSIEDGIYTIYDTSNNIYRQYNLYEIRDQFNELLYEVRQDRGDNIDNSKNFDNIIA